MKTIRYLATMSILLFAGFPAAEASAAAATNGAPSRVARRMLLAGGFVRRPGVKATRIAVLNGEREIPSSEFGPATKYLSQQLRVDVEVRDVELADGPAEIRRAVAESSADFAVVVGRREDCDGTLAVFPDQRYAIVNTAALRAEGGDALPFLKARTRKEVIRGLLMVAGGFAATRGRNLMCPVHKVTDLDKIVGEDIPIEVLSRIIGYLKSAGMPTFERAPYFKACQEGWAPAPTNEYQKAIWDRVHEPPSKPIKITYDKDRQKPVVK